MSRIGKKPVPIIDGVKVGVSGNVVTVEGPLATLKFEHRPEVTVSVNGDDNQVEVTRQDDSRPAKAFHGLTRSLVENMILGVKEGYEKKLELQGVGYICSIQGNVLKLRVGLANELQKVIPKGLDVTCPDQTHITVKGSDKQQVGQFAAEVRLLRKPEPYKGKGIRYVGEQVKLKPGKSAT
jgi:large subunit ribosomal protein L6